MRERNPKRCLLSESVSGEMGRKGRFDGQNYNRVLNVEKSIDQAASDLSCLHSVGYFQSWREKSEFTVPD